MAGKFSFTLQEYKDAARKYRSDFLRLPIIGCEETLEAKVSNLPAASTTAIVDDKKHEDHEPTAYEQFINASETARKLYDSLP